MGLDPEKHIIKEIKKRKNVIIRISKFYVLGHPYIEIRQYYRGKEGVFRASKKGVSFVPELLDDVIEGLIELKRDVDKE